MAAAFCHAPRAAYLSPFVSAARASFKKATARDFWSPEILSMALLACWLSAACEAVGSAGMGFVWLALGPPKSAGAREPNLAALAFARSVASSLRSTSGVSDQR